MERIGCRFFPSFRQEEKRAIRALAGSPCESRHISVSSLSANVAIKIGFLPSSLFALEPPSCESCLSLTHRLHSLYLKHFPESALLDLNPFLYRIKSSSGFLIEVNFKPNSGLFFSGSQSV